MLDFSEDATDEITILMKTDEYDLEAVLYDSEYNIQENPEELKAILISQLKAKYGNDETEMESVYGNSIDINYIKYNGIAARDQDGPTADSTIKAGIGKGVVWFQRV